MAALSDAQFVAPLIHTGDTLAPQPALPGQEKSGPKCFFYVFDYQTKDGDYPQVITVFQWCHRLTPFVNTICQHHFSKLQKHSECI